MKTLRRPIAAPCAARSLGFRGFTLIELIVSIGVIGLLLSLLLPAVQQTRESARATECLNHLHQCELGIRLHEQSHGWYPTGGWGKNWIGLPGRGYGPDQPGGWVFNILPYVEQGNLRGTNFDPGNPADLKANAERIATPIEMFHCPTRRAADPYDNSRQPLYCDPIAAVARGDYAMNGGDRRIRYGDGPATLAEATSFAWPDMSQASGLTCLRSRIRVQQVQDGLSNTYLVGEKHLRKDRYRNGLDQGDNESLLSGDDLDLVRFSGLAGIPSYAPRSDDFASTFEGEIFGSAHPSGFRMAMADGAVRVISYVVSLTIHRQMAHRHDATPLGL